MEYSIQRIDNGNMVDIFPSLESAQPILSRYPDILEAVPTNTSKLEVYYVELAGPSGYGCNIPEFTTYGGVKRVIINFIKWAMHSAEVFGPDKRDIRDFYRNLRIYINDENHSDWWDKNYQQLVDKYGF